MMRSWRLALLLLDLMLMSVGVAPALAHVPYIERGDYSWEEPFEVVDVEQSKAVYAWLETGEDVDAYAFEVTEPVDLFVEVIVPTCPAYEQFLPSYAVIGPQLPVPTEPLPVELPEGYDPFGDKSYYVGVPTSEQITNTGSWAVIVWDPYGQGGDYVTSVGLEENFSNRGDLLRSIINTRYVRDGQELHTDCGDGT